MGIASPLTWNLVGDPDENQIEVRQNAGDEASPLTRSPECPQNMPWARSLHLDGNQNFLQGLQYQEEYVYDYAYADSDSGHGGGAEENEIPEVAAPRLEKPQPSPSPRSEYQDYDEPEYTEYEADLENEYVYDEIDETDPTASVVHDGFVAEDSLPEEGGSGGGSGEGFVCPGGDLQTCVDVCPGQFGAKVYGACVL